MALHWTPFFPLSFSLQCIAYFLVAAEIYSYKHVTLPSSQSSSLVKNSWNFFLHRFCSLMTRSPSYICSLWPSQTPHQPKSEREWSKINKEIKIRTFCQDLGYWIGRSLASCKLSIAEHMWEKGNSVSECTLGRRVLARLQPLYRMEKSDAGWEIIKKTDAQNGAGIPGVT